MDGEPAAERGTFERSTVTASDGAFAFAAVPENITLSVLRFEDRARVALRKQLKVAEGARERIELVLPTPRESVRVVVLDERDTPVELAEVRATSLDANAPLRATLFTDALGAVTLSDALGLSLRACVSKYASGASGVLGKRAFFTGVMSSASRTFVL